MGVDEREFRNILDSWLKTSDSSRMDEFYSSLWSVEVSSR